MVLCVTLQYDCNVCVCVFQTLFSGCGGGASVGLLGYRTESTGAFHEVMLDDGVRFS